jgi:enamine deaminase RidA (YjgF/YER057c/UK114 family)
MNEPVIPASGQASYDSFHFAPGVKAGNLLLCSGQIGVGPDGACPDDAEDEFTLAFEKVGEILKEAGVGFEDIVEMTSFHTSMKALGKFMKVKDRFVSEPYPAWTAIGCTELAVPGALVEVKVIAQLS